MATPTDTQRPSTGPLTKTQRERLEALQFSKRLLDDHRATLDVDHLLRVAHYIETGETYL